MTSVLIAGCASTSVHRDDSAMNVFQQQIKAIDSPAEASYSLANLLLNNHYAADIFVTDVDGNGEKDFVVRHVGGIGDTDIYRAFQDVSLHEAAMKVQFAQWALGGINLMLNELVTWEANLIYLIHTDEMRKIPVYQVVRCSSDLGDKEWTACLLRTYLASEKSGSDLAYIDKLFANTPPNGLVKRFHTEHSEAVVTLTSPQSDSDYLIKFENKDTGKKVALVFLSSGEKVQVALPLGTYEVKWASGREWNGLEYLFGPETLFARLENYIALEKREKEVTAYTLMFGIDGNIRTESISREDF